MTPQETLIQRRIIAAYTFILTALPGEIVSAAARLARHRGGVRWRGGSEDPVHHPADLLLRSWYESLAAIVALLVRLDLPPRSLVNVMRSESPRGIGCQNRDCGAGPGEIRRNGQRKGHPETYCRECGSRFLGTQIIESYDFGHGDPRLSPQSVRNARARLLRRQVAVADAARRLRAQRPAGRITIGEVFAEARIPNARNLQARRLGLVTIARAVLAGRVPQCDGPARHDPARWLDHLAPPTADMPSRAIGASHARLVEASEGHPVGTTRRNQDHVMSDPAVDATSFAAFMARFPDELSCLRELAARRWPTGFRCPGCGGSRSTILRQGRIWHCSACDEQTAVTAGTLVFGSNLSLRTWFAAAHLVVGMPGITVADLSGRLGIGLRAAAAVRDRLLAASPLDAIDPPADDDDGQPSSAIAPIL